MVSLKGCNVLGGKSDPGHLGSSPITFTVLQMQPQATLQPNEILAAPRSELKNLNKIFLHLPLFVGLEQRMLLSMVRLRAQK